MKTLTAPAGGTIARLLLIATFTPLCAVFGQTNGTWTADASGNWNDFLNWGGANVASGATATANFSTLDITGNHAVTVDAPFTIGTLIAADLTTLSHSWQFTGAGPLTLDNGGSQPVINIVNRTPTVSVPLVGINGFAKSGGGALLLNGDNSLLSGTMTLENVTGTNDAGVQVFNNTAIGGITTVNVNGTGSTGQYFGLSGGVTLGSGVTINLNSPGGNSAPSGALRSLGTNAQVNAVDGPVNLLLNNCRISNNSAQRLDLNGVITGGAGINVLIRNAVNEGVHLTNTGNAIQGKIVSSGGILWVEPGALPATAALEVAASDPGTFQTSGSFSRALGAAAGQVRVGVGASSGRAMGFSARGGDLNVNFGGSAAEVVFNNFTASANGTDTTINTNTLILNNVTADSKITVQNPLNLNGTNRTIQVSANEAVLAGGINGGANTLTKAGTGTLTFGGASGWTGPLVVPNSGTASGWVRVANSLGLGPDATAKTIAMTSATAGATGGIELTGGVTVNNKAITIGGRNVNAETQEFLRNVSGDNAWNGNVTIANSGGSYSIRCNAGKLTLGGTLSNTVAASTRAFDLRGPGEYLISGSLVDAAGVTALRVGLSATDAGQLVTLTGTNTHSGATTIGANGILQVGNGGTTGDLGTGAVTNSSTLRFDYGIGGLLNAGNAISGAGNLVKTGAGTVNLSGSLTYTGGTDVQQGTLGIDGNLPPGPLTVAPGATLSLANTLITGNPALDIDGTLDLAGTVRIVLPGEPAPGTYPMVVQYGALTGAGSLTSVYRGTSVTVGATSADLTFGPGINLTWTGSAGSNWDVDASQNWQDAILNPEKFFWLDNVTFDATGAAAPAVNLTTEVQPGSVTVNEAVVDYSFSGPGFIAGPAALTKSGAAKLTIATNNTNTGLTTVNAGILEIGNGGTTGWMGSGNIINDASLVFNRSNNVTAANLISGTGSLTKQGAGALILTADNGYTGGTTISASELHVGAQATTGSLGTGDIVNDAILRLNRADGANPYAYTFANNISGIGQLVVGQATAGSLDAVVTLTGTNTYAGNIDVRSGGIKIQNVAALGTGPKLIILTNGTAGRPQFYLDGSGGNLDLSADIDFRTSSPEIARPAIGNVAGDNIIRGDIDMTSGGGDTTIAVQGGSLVIEGNISASVTGRFLQLGGSPGTTGTINGIFSNGTNPAGLKKLQDNTWILNGNNSYTAATTVSGGTLVINGNQTSATGSITVSSGATLGGIGIHGGNITANSGSTLAPGTTIGTFTGLGAVTVAGTLKNEIDATSSDRLTVGGELNISAATLDIDELAAAAAPVYVIASYDVLSGPFAAILDLPAGYNINYNYNGLKQIALVAGGDAYGDWETLNGIVGAGSAVDSDDDGIANGIEFVIGGDPSGPGSNSNDKLPTVTVDATYLNFTFRRTDESASYSPFVEYGSNLTGWTQAQAGVGGVIINEVDDGFGASIDSVEVKIPRALATPGTSLFARLRIDIP
jgi:autotransporter-associated beta strand protein